jgi:hypothetical protein
MPTPFRTFEWLRQHRDLVPRYLGEFGVATAANQFVVFSVGALGGLPEAGALRGAQLLFGPLNILFQGSGLVAVPEGARLLSISKAKLHVFCRFFAMCFAITVGTVPTAVYTAASVGLKAMAAADLSLRARLFVAPVTLAAAMIGTVWLGAYGTVWGITIAGVVAAVIWWHSFSTALRGWESRLVPVNTRFDIATSRTNA